MRNWKLQKQMLVAKRNSDIKAFYPYKRVDYAYATSPDAAKFGFSKTGCFTVDLVPRDCKPAKAIAGYATPAEARAHADKLTQPYHRLTK